MQGMQDQQISVVDSGYVVDPVDSGTPNQPHNPDQPRYFAAWAQG
jgi:hypothetical protein